MNKTIKSKWLTALNSGEYTQGTMELRYNDDGTLRHCCLGVLCELYKKDTGNGEWIPKRGFQALPTARVKFSACPVEVATWAELTHYDPTKKEEIPDNGYDVVKLARLNDMTTSYEYAIEYITENL